MAAPAPPPADRPPVPHCPLCGAPAATCGDGEGEGGLVLTPGGQRLLETPAPRPAANDD